MINRVTLIGRITRDLEIRKTGNGTSVLSFNVAVNRDFKSNDGQDADFIGIQCWGKIAENTALYCGKGSLVGIDGRIQSRSYQKDGRTVFITEVVANSIQFLDPKKREDDFYDSYEVEYPADLDEDLEF